MSWIMLYRFNIFSSFFLVQNEYYSIFFSWVHAVKIIMSKVYSNYIYDKRKFIENNIATNLYVLYRYLCMDKINLKPNDNALYLLYY